MPPPSEQPSTPDASSTITGDGIKGTPVPPPHPTPDWRTMHLWHIQPVRDVLALLVFIGIIYLGYVLRPVTVPMLLALMLAYLFEPLVKRLTRLKRVSRPMAVSGILATFVLVVIIPLIIGLGFAIVQTASLAGNVARNTGTLVASIRSETEPDRKAAFRKLPSGWRWMSTRMNDLREEVETYRARQKPLDGTAPPEEHPSDPANPHADPAATPAETPKTPPDAPANPDPKAKTKDATAAPEVSEWKMDLYELVDRGIDWVRANAEGLAKTAGQRALSGGAEAAILAVGALMSVINIGITVFLTGFFFFFFSVSWGSVLRFWAEFIPRAKRSKTFDLIEKMDAVIAGFVRGRLTICAILAVLMTILYWFIGVPMPIVLGLAVGMLFIVPFIHIIGWPIAMLLLWLDPSRGPLATMVGGVTGFSGHEQATWWWILFAPLAVYLIAQFLDDWVLSPMIAGKATNMDTPTILFASLAGGVLAGLYGVLLAIPVAACIKILIQDAVWPRFKAWAAGKSPDFLPLQTAAEKAGAKKSPSP